MTTHTNRLTRRFDYLPPDRDDLDISREVASGGIWSAFGIGANIVLQFVRSIIFARLLMPEDFGVMSLANVFTQFILIFANFGIASSVIYHKQLTKNDLSTCFWGNVLIDALASAACVGVAMISTHMNGDPRIMFVIILLAGQFFLSSLGSVNQALMRREFMFKQITAVNVAGAVVTFLGGWFCVAVMDWGVYGLCAGMIVGSLVMTLMNFGYLPWLPTFRFSGKSLRKHLNYGRWFLGVSVVSYINSNIDRVTISGVVNNIQLGFYEYAANIPMMLANRISQVLNSVLFSAFSSIQDKPEELQNLLLKIYRYNSMIIFPFLTGIALVAPDFILLAYGEKWMPILLPLRLFCLYGIFRLYSQPLQVLCNGIGKPNLPFKWSMIFIPVNLGLLYLGVSRYGISGAVGAKMFLPIFLTIAVGVPVMREIGLPWLRLLNSTWPAISGCLIMAVAVISLEIYTYSLIGNAYVRLVLYSVVGVATYTVSVFLLHRAELMRIFDFFKNYRSSGNA